MSAFHKAIQEHARRLSGPDIAHQVWTRLLTDAERQQLGDLESQYSDGGAVGIWTRAKSIRVEHAVIELSRKFGLPDATYHWLRREMGSPVEDHTPRVPGWDSESSVLRLDDKVIRRISRRARNMIAILNTFEECGWPPRVDNPLSGPSDSTRLADAVRRLNSGLDQIRFSRDGTGEGVTWSYCE